MSNGKEEGGYRLLKWVWILYLASLSPLAMIYMSSPESRLGVVSMSRIGLSIFGASFVIFWIATQSLLAVYRFPKGTVPAARLLAGQALQAALALVAAPSWSFALYTCFVSILTALCVLVLALSGWKLLARPIRLFRVLVYVCFVALCFLFYQIFLGPLSIGFSALSGLSLVVIIAAMAVNVVNTVLVLYHFPVLAKPVRLGPDYDRVWQRWAPPTMVLLIASAVAATVMAGVHGIR